MYLENGRKNILKKIVRKRHYTSVLLFTGKKSYSSCGAERYINNQLSGCEIKRVYDFATNPDSKDVHRIRENFDNKRFDAIIAIGGGSVIDFAKLVNFFHTTGSPVDEYLKNPESSDRQLLPIIAIPTTAGTGSEATHFAVMYHNGKKYSVVDPQLKPQTAILYPELTINNPPYLTAVSGFDALAQAVESLWATASTRSSRYYSKIALKAIYPAIKQSVKKADLICRKRMMIGSYYAGKAINISKTTGPHGLSYFFTTNYGLPHGHAVALFLGRFFEYNYDVSDDDCNHPKGIHFIRSMLKIVFRVLHVSSAHDAGKKINELAETIGLFHDPYKCGFNINSQNDRNRFMASINLERINNNPRKINERNLIDLFSDR